MTKNCSCDNPNMCINNGYYHIEEEDKNYFKECKKYKEFISAKIFNEKIKTLLPKNFWNKKLDNYYPKTNLQEKALNISQQYINKKLWKKGMNIIISGGYGVGKSHILCAIAKEIIKNNDKVFFISAPNLLGTIEEINNNFKNAAESDIVFIDDLANELNNNYIMQKIFQMINHLYEQEKSLIFSTNYSLKHFQNQIGERCWDRLNEKTKYIRIDGESYRKKLNNVEEIFA